MHISELVQIALANSDARRVEVAALESCAVAVEAVSALSQLISELVDNAIAFSENGDKVRVTGVFEQGSYLITVSDRGVGIPEHLMNALNRALDDPSRLGPQQSNLGVALIARLAARHGIKVRLVPGVPGTTARVTIPSRLLGPAAPTDQEKPPSMETQALSPAREISKRLREKAEEEFTLPAREVADTVAASRFEDGAGSGTGVVAMSEEARVEAEEFLDKVFAPLLKQPGMTERPQARPPANGNGIGQSAPKPTRPPTQPDTGATVTTLRRRVPGENYSPVEDDPSTVAAERAVDIRSALSKYSEGRRSAEKAGHEDAATPGK